MKAHLITIGILVGLALFVLVFIYAPKVMAVIIILAIFALIYQVIWFTVDQKIKDKERQKQWTFSPYKKDGE